MNSSFKDDIFTKGFSIIPNVLSMDEVKTLKLSLAGAIDSQYMRYKAEGALDYGMVLLCSLYGTEFIELFNNEKLTGPFEEVLGEGCIVYAYTSSSMPPKGKNFSTRIHNDCPRIIPNYVTNMGATILLDDFTEENGATWFLPNSHTEEVEPVNFYENAKRVIAPAGSVFFFNASLWHAGGVNSTQHWRHALTINMCRSYMKQRIDIPRAMSGINVTNMTEKSLQKLGFRSQPPASMEEYLLPKEQRTFRQKTE